MGGGGPTARRGGVSGVSRSAPSELLEMLTEIGTRTTLKKGQDLFQQGDVADALYVLQEGQLAINSISEDGRRLTHVLLDPGTVFGEMALFDGGHRSATVTARARSVLRRIAGPELEAAIRRNPDLALAFLRLTIGRMQWMSDQLEDHVFQPVGVRLGRRLVLMLETSAGENVLRISQAELADYIGATREAVSKALSEMKAAGIVGLGRGRIDVIDLRALYALADLDSQ